VRLGSFCRRSRVLMRPCRRRGAVYSIPPWSTRRQFSQSPPSPPDSEGGGLAGYGLGASVGRPIADRIFLMVSSVLISAMRRRGLLQRGQIVSISKERFSYCTSRSGCDSWAD
jgi:hypothetical protein